MSKKGIPTSTSNLICLECGCRMPIPRQENLKRPSNHIKTMMCPICKKETNFIENINIDTLHNVHYKKFLIDNNLVFH